MIKKTVKNNLGFTLLELLIVIGIIGILSAIGMSSYSNVQMTGRNVKRKADLKSLKTALEQYYSENGLYPNSGGAWRGICSGYGSYPDTGANGYIPGLAPTYIDTLPHDPRESRDAVCGAGSASSSCYLYFSTGTDYKLLAHCTPEGTLSPTDAFYDPSRPTWAWQTHSSSTSMNW